MVYEHVRDKLPYPAFVDLWRAAGQEHRQAGACLPHSDRRPSLAAGARRRAKPVSGAPPRTPGRRHRRTGLLGGTTKSTRCPRPPRRGMRGAASGLWALLAGEPGIGKTRTALELTTHAKRCQSATYTLGPLPRGSRGAALLALGADPSRGPARRRSRTARRPGRRRRRHRRIVPEIRQRLPGLEAPARLADPSEARFRMFDWIRQFLASISRRGRLLSARRSALGRRAFAAPVRIPRSGDRRMPAAAGRHLSGDRGIPPAPVVRYAGRAGAGAAFPAWSSGGAERRGSAGVCRRRRDGAPAWLTKAMHDQTEGNPLFLREVVRFLAARRTRGGADPDIGSVPAAMRIPEGVREVIGRRLNLLSAACNEVLAVAAVIGREFTWEVLLRAATRSAKTRCWRRWTRRWRGHRRRACGGSVSVRARADPPHPIRRTAHRPATPHAIARSARRSKRSYRADMDPLLPRAGATLPGRRRRGRQRTGRSTMRCVPAAVPTPCSPSRMRCSSFRRPSTRSSSGPSPTSRRAAGCCCCWGGRSANPTISRMR